MTTVVTALPLLALRITAGPVELRGVTDELIVPLAELAIEGHSRSRSHALLHSLVADARGGDAAVHGAVPLGPAGWLLAGQMGSRPRGALRGRACRSAGHLHARLPDHTHRGHRILAEPPLPGQGHRYRDAAG